MIIAYNKYVTKEITRELILPYDDIAPIGQELATVDGVTYVHFPDTAELPEQPKEIADSIKIVEPDEELKARIKAASPHVNLINQRVGEKIAERYSVTDEIKLLRSAPSAAFDEYNVYVEECRAWGKVEKAKLGL